MTGPRIMKLTPSRMKLRTTGRLVRAASRETAPVIPMPSQNKPVTTADVKIAPSAIASEWVTAIVPMTFIGCTDIGVRK